MNLALIIAGGNGKRMMSDTPKQFIEVFNKPIIIYTLEIFDSHDDIDAIIVSCISSQIDYLNNLVKKYKLNKVQHIVAGGETGQDSIYNGLKIAHSNYPEDSTILVHDAVRPFITHQTISDNIKSVRDCKNCITCTPVTETIIIQKNYELTNIPKRSECMIARAPQSFILKDMIYAHECARKDNKHDFIDSLSIMNYYHAMKMHLICGPTKNIKITNPEDLYYFNI